MGPRVFPNNYGLSYPALTEQLSSQDTLPMHLILNLCG